MSGMYQMMKNLIIFVFNLSTIKDLECISGTRDSISFKFCRTVGNISIRGCNITLSKTGDRKKPMDSRASLQDSRVDWMWRIGMR